MSEEVEKSCRTCAYFFDGSHPDRYFDESSECHHDGSPPMHALKNFPFEDGCKFYEVDIAYDDEKLKEWIEWMEKQDSEVQER